MIRAMWPFFVGGCWSLKLEKVEQTQRGGTAETIIGEELACGALDTLLELGLARFRTFSPGVRK